MNACIETRFHYIEFKQNQYPLFSKFFKSENQWLLFFLWLILLIKDNCNNGSNSTEKEKHKINKSYNINLIPIPCFFSLFSCFFSQQQTIPASWQNIYISVTSMKKYCFSKIPITFMSGNMKEDSSPPSDFLIYSWHLQCFFIHKRWDILTLNL